MKKYEYKFIKVERKSGFNIEVDEGFEKCKEIIVQEAENGWRFVQIVMPFNEKTGINRALGYEVIFERELD